MFLARNFPPGVRADPASAELPPSDLRNGLECKINCATSKVSHWAIVAKGTVAIGLIVTQCLPMAEACGQGGLLLLLSCLKKLYMLQTARRVLHQGLFHNGNQNRAV